MPMLDKVLSHTFRKRERLCSKKRIEALFSAGNRSLAAYPLRAVYVMEDKGSVPAQVLISVPKRIFKRAVDRNRMKRLIREAYRLNKHILWKALDGQHMILSFLWIGDQMATYATVQAKVQNLLQRISDEISLSQEKSKREGNS